MSFCRIKILLLDIKKAVCLIILSSHCRFSPVLADHFQTKHNVMQVMEEVAELKKIKLQISGGDSNVYSWDRDLCVSVYKVSHSSQGIKYPNNQEPFTEVLTVDNAQHFAYSVNQTCSAKFELFKDYKNLKFSILENVWFWQNMIHYKVPLVFDMSQWFRSWLLKTSRSHQMTSFKILRVESSVLWMTHTFPSHPTGKIK